MTHLAKKYNFCAGNRTGDLCGKRVDGFSVAILSGKCVPDTTCGGNLWFWALAFIGTLVYSIWYTFKDDVLLITSVGIS